MTGSKLYATRQAQLLSAQIEAFRNRSDEVRLNAPSRGNALVDLNRPDLAFNPDTLRPLDSTPATDLSYVADTMKYGDFAHIPFSVDVGAQLILSRPQAKRIFLLIENTHPSQNLYVGFGTEPNTTIGVTILPGGDLFLDAVVPQNDVYIAGAGAATVGNITYCNQEFGRG